MKINSNNKPVLTVHQHKLSSCILDQAELHDFSEKTGYGIMPDPKWYNLNNLEYHYYRIDMYLEDIMYEVEDGLITSEVAVSKLNALNKVLADSNLHHLIIPPYLYGLDPDVGNPFNRSNSTGACDAYLEWLMEKSNEDPACLSLCNSVILQSTYGFRAQDSFTINMHNKDQSADYLEYDESDLLPRSEVLPWINFMYLCLYLFRLETGHVFHYHGERHIYAHNLYRQLWQEITGVGVDCAAVLSFPREMWLSYASEKAVMDISQVIETDKQIRNKVLKFLNIRNAACLANYLGY